MRNARRKAANGNSTVATIVGGKTPGRGTVFQITPAGTLTDIALSLILNGTDGREPLCGTCAWSDGKFLRDDRDRRGPTSYGECVPDSSAGTFTQLYNSAVPTGLGPRAALVQGCDGQFLWDDLTRRGRTAPARYSNSPFPSIPAGQSD